MIGENSVVASDILQSMIDGATESVNSLRTKGVKFDVTPVRGDLCGDFLEIDLKSEDRVSGLAAIRTPASAMEAARVSASFS